MEPLLLGVTPQVDFRDAHAMRLLGFDARTLQCAGFKDLGMHMSDDTLFPLNW